jgi:hypothetical protein
MIRLNIPHPREESRSFRRKGRVGERDPIARRCVHHAWTKRPSQFKKTINSARLGAFGVHVLTTDPRAPQVVHGAFSDASMKATLTEAPNGSRGRV